MGPAGDSPVANNIYPVAHSIDNLRKLVERAPRPVELTPTVIGYHNSGGTDVASALCICNTHDAFEAKLFTPFFSNDLGILPIHRLVEHCAKIIANRNRYVRPLHHTIGQLRQCKFLVHEVIDRPPRMHGEAEGAPES